MQKPRIQPDRASGDSCRISTPASLTAHLTPGRSQPHVLPENQFQLRPRFSRDEWRDSDIANCRQVVRLLADMCKNGDCAAPQAEFLRRTCDSGIEAPRPALGLAIRDGGIYREAIDGQTLLFPSELRDAEQTIVRCARHLAEGRKEKFKLVNSENHGATVDFLLSLVRTSNERMSFLAADLESARWWAMKIEEPVFVLRSWLRTDFTSSIDPKGFRWTHANRANQIVLLDSSRHGIESLAAILEAIPQSTFVTLIGSLDETPTNGHGQPFHDLVESKAFPVTAISQKGCWGNPVAQIPPARRRSALKFRLQRACGIESAYSYGRTDP